jgi:hypothetical protein
MFSRVAPRSQYDGRDRILGRLRCCAELSFAWRASTSFLLRTASGCFHPEDERQQQVS